jgi:hypothetical protein
VSVIVEDIKNEELANVHAIAIRMKPINFDKFFEGGTLLIINIHESMTSHGYPMCTLKTRFSIYKNAILQYLPIYLVHPIVIHGVSVGLFAFKLCTNGHYANVNM